MLCDGDQRDRGDSVHVPPDPEILGGQTFLWEVMRGKGKRGFPALPPQTVRVLPFRGFALTAANCLLPKPTHRKGTENI